MPLDKHYEKRERRRYTRHSTKSRLIIRPPAHPGRIVAVIVAVVAVIVLALICGSILKKRSDAYREAQEEGRWTLDATIATPRPSVDLPELRAISITPGESVGDILIAGHHDGILVPLCGEDGAPLFLSRVAEAAGMVLPPEAISLPDEVARISRRELYVTCVFSVTFAADSDPATAAYRRGLELALLREYAEAGMDDLLLLGLPMGDEASDARTVAFLSDLAELMADLPEPPAVGVALPLEALAGEPSAPSEDTASDDTADIGGEVHPLYAGNYTPSRLRRVCDYLALDLRTYTAEMAEDLLPHIRYAYVRHSLRLLLPREGEAVDAALAHGFDRVFEMEAPASVVE